MVFTNPETTYITVHVEQGTLELGEIRLYGYTDTALPVPASLRAWLDEEATSSECNDFAFF